MVLIALVIFSVILGVFLGAGYLLSLLVPFTFFQSTIVVFGNVFLILFFISLIVVINKLQNIEDWFTVYDEDEDEDEEQDRNI